MDIQKTDKNFKVSIAESNKTMRYFTIPDPHFALYGIFYDTDRRSFLRMPYETAQSVSEGCFTLNAHTSGGRLRFSTDSEYISIRVTWNSLTDMPHMPRTGSSGFTLIDETMGHRFVTTFWPDQTDRNGFFRTIRPGKTGMRNYILYFPLYNDVTSVTLGLDEDCRIGKGKAYKDIPPVLYYGSSITQGGCASRPDNSYPALISKWTNTDFLDLGFSGNALAEQAMAEYLSSIPCSAFVFDYDHNAPSAAYLEKTHLSFYKLYRSTRKETPILLLSRPDGERDPEEKLRADIIRRTFRYAKSCGDNNIYLLNGKKLFKKKDRENCTVDGTHPNDLGFYKMAQEIYRQLLLIKIF